MTIGMVSCLLALVARWALERKVLFFAWQRGYTEFEGCDEMQIGEGGRREFPIVGHRLGKECR